MGKHSKDQGIKNARENLPYSLLYMAIKTAVDNTWPLADVKYYLAPHEFNPAWKQITVLFRLPDFPNGQAIASGVVVEDKSKLSEPAEVDKLVLSVVQSIKTVLAGRPTEQNEKGILE